MASDEIVRKYAELSRLELSEDEVATFAPQLEAILRYIDKLRELDVDSIEPTAHPVPVFDTYRNDLVTPGIDREAFLRNAPDQASGQLRVPKVIEEA
jgi:aspartyl-tRNA(Asn)/glutamyl-tRNA(Gln) amidotransferase subunit C